MSSELNDFVPLLAGLWAGTQNALAGGGSFVTIPALMFAGLDARVANMTSAVALFPGQLATGWAGRSMIPKKTPFPLRALWTLGAVGGALGALLLRVTPTDSFERLLPLLMAFATGLFAFSAFRPGNANRAKTHLPTGMALAMQAAIATYGGYFGGGLGFLMVASLSLSGLSTREASAIKNMQAALINSTCVLVFMFVGDVAWSAALGIGVGAIIGGLLGQRLLSRIPERPLRLLVSVIGVVLTALLWRAEL